MIIIKRTELKKGKPVIEIIIEKLRDEIIGNK